MGMPPCCAIIIYARFLGTGNRILKLNYTPSDTPSSPPEKRTYLIEVEGVVSVELLERTETHERWQITIQCDAQK
jgi:hypothetical protein